LVMALFPRNPSPCVLVCFHYSSSWSLLSLSILLLTLLPLYHHLLFIIVPLLLVPILFLPRFLFSHSFLARLPFLSFLIAPCSSSSCSSSSAFFFPLLLLSVHLVNSACRWPPTLHYADHEQIQPGHQRVAVSSGASPTTPTPEHLSSSHSQQFWILRSRRRLILPPPKPQYIRQPGR
jgi:hypothetical protein